MEILRALGVDSTLFVHLVCFGVSYFFLTTLVLNPYMKAMREREKRTVGNEETALRTIEEAGQLQSEYEQKAKSLNAEIKRIYDASRTEALAQYEKLVHSARGEAAVALKTSQAELQNEIQAARKTLAAEVPNVGAAIATKLAGKEISL